MMKMTMPFIGTLLVGLTALAQVPVELRNLIPAGSNSIRMEGLTPNQTKCRVMLSAQGDGFSADVYALKTNGQMDSKKFAKFQIGFGHELQSLETNGDVLTVVSAHEAEEVYSSDTRSTLTVQYQDGVISSFQILEEAKGWFSYHTEADVTCSVQ